ncbi:MAG: hypothetical protein ACP5HM_09415 [Anaerolineae bacterium]
MRTPQGRECPYYYVDTRRWREGREERCLLLKDEEDIAHWSSQLCRRCPVPAIRRANTCPHMTLHAHVGRRPWHFWEAPRMLIHATCTRSEGPVQDPYVGCGRCHQTLEFVVVAEDERPEEEQET